MGNERRANTAKRFYYRSERRGNRIVKRYVGPSASPAVQLVERMDRLYQACIKAGRQRERTLESDALDQAITRLFRTVRAIGRSYENREVNMASKSPSFRATMSRALPSQGVFSALCHRADRGSEKAQRELCELLDEHPVLWQSVGDLSRLMEAHLIDQTSGPNTHLRESVRRTLHARRQELSTAGVPLERMLIDRVLTSWLEVQVRQLKVMAPQSEQMERKLQRRLDQAQRRHLDAVESLARYQGFVAKASS